MKTLSWFCWLLLACVCLSEAKNNIKRPLVSPYSPIVILRRPRPISHRVSMGNTIHIGGSLPHQRVPYKHVAYRIRRPTTYNAVSIMWKNQPPIRAPLSNGISLPQRAPAKDFHSVNKVAPGYSPEYRPGLVALPTTHREGVDDDKGPIHTIPAPNLSLAKPYESPINSDETANRRPISADYNTTAQNSVTNIFGLSTRSDSLPQKTSRPTLPQHQYEVTESNDVTLKDHRTLKPPDFQPQSLDLPQLYTFLLNNPYQQSYDFPANQPVQSNIESSVQFPHSSVSPVQTNLHDSLHVGFPSVQAPYTTTQQIPADLHGHSASTGQALSATQLYDLLNTSPYNVNQYSSDRQHFLQDQLGQSFQPYLNAAMSFPHPQMQSFNFNDQQANQLQQQQQQQILFDQKYVPESAISDYNLDFAESSSDIQNDMQHEELTYPTGEIEQFGNNIEYEKLHRETPATYFDRAADNNGISTNFYTMLPNKEAAEKLAVLAAAGNINSYLIDQLRKQQQEKDVQRNNQMPFNHKNDENDDDGGGGDSGGDNDDGNINEQIKDDQQWQYDIQKSHQTIQHDHQNQSYKIQSNEKLPLQITIPDKDTYVTSNDTLQNTDRDMEIEYEYEYENEDERESKDSHVASSSDGKTFSHANSHKEFGSRLH